ncbi:MAG: hypothetical protein RBS39_05575 [Phycisphaerales bacterium]|jgi:hypothetical protein|nr:hypothetical protein [Phycisphaerales bacterium]
MRRERVIQLVACLVMLAMLAGSGVVAGAIARSTGRNQLAYADTAGANDPPQVALGIAMGALRGVFVNMLWIRANVLKEEGKFYEAIELSRTITRLQPRFPRVWAFHAWNMAYNISVTTQTEAERWQWVSAGIDLLRKEGIPANPDDMLLHKELAWIFLHKIGGYTDDSNLYYKRMLAAEWEVVLGPPPTPDPTGRDRDAVTEKYAQWLQPIVDAPDTLSSLEEQHPEVRALVDDLRTQAGIKPDIDLLRRVVAMQLLQASPRRAMIERAMGERSAAISRLYLDPARKSAWDALLPHVRRRVIIDNYHMEPDLMQRYTRYFGPLDWRHCATHAVYWSHRGVERALQRVTERNKRDFDFINTDRVTIQAVQELYRSGEIYFSMLDFILGDPAPTYLGMPSPSFADTYGRILDSLIGRSWADRASRGQRPYASGYDNFLKDVIRFFYRRGQRDEAEHYYEVLRTWAGQDIHEGAFRREELSLPLDDFVNAQFEDERYGTPYVANSEIVAALQGAYVSGLIAGDLDVFKNSFEYAARFHRAYFTYHIDATIANRATGPRAGLYMDKDFRVVAGGVFAALIGGLDFDNAERMYNNAPNDLRQFAYDILVETYKPAMDEDEAGSFDKSFPEPEGMDEFRAWTQRRLEEQRQLQLDVEQN